MISVELFTPKGVSKGLYHYGRTSDFEIVCWADGKEAVNGYNLTWTGTSWSCNCMGHTYRRTCAHVEHCPYGRPSELDASIGVSERAARNAFVTLANGKIVNCFDYFWKKGESK